MQRQDGQILYSASDLTFFAECAHRTWLDRLHLDAPMEKAEDDEQSRLVQARGIEHERDYLDRIRAETGDCVEVSEDLPLRARVEATRAAMRSGAHVIYQATLRRDDLIGHADFLLRVGEAPLGGAWQYEVSDTKLARSAKAKFVLQLCFYSDLVSDLTGRLPRQMHVELGSGVRESFRVADYHYYYRNLLGRFRDFVATYPNGSPPYPMPCEHCGLCPWRDRCAARRLADDHLSGVANITRQQIVRLEASGIRTMAQLATVPANTRVGKLAADTLDKLRQQAALQVEGRLSGRLQHVVLPLSPGEIRGFARLPEPDAGDLFFDMEGDPLYDGGLEYLFGVYLFEDGRPVFKAFWAHDRQQEREAFVEFIDFVMARCDRYPGMHVYHYAHYENTALKRLMSLHGVREPAVDQLLREHRLVDLYKVVREGLRLSTSDYSIKSVEAFYAEGRHAEVKKATDSIVAYEHWRDTGEPGLLESIRQYNEDDCRSTWQLREWLLTLRPASLPWYSAPCAEEGSGTSKRPKSDKTIRLEAELERFRHRLMTEPENPALDPRFAQLLYALLDFHRRAAKPAWWALFERQDMEPDALLEDPEVIAGMCAPEWLGSGERYDRYRYRFPDQDFKVRAGDQAVRLDNLRPAIVVAVDEEAGTAHLELQTDDDGMPPEHLDISIGAPVPSDPMRNALFGFADAAIRGEPRYRAITDYLFRHVPRIRGRVPGEPIIEGHADVVSEATDAVLNLDQSYLFIQGPPGTGKTYTGSHLIAALLSAGKRVAVSSNSHKAINNLLEAVDCRIKERGGRYFGMKKVSSEEHRVSSEFIENVAELKAIVQASPKPQLVAGTAWLLSRPEFCEAFDYLFIDEAGQVSLANTIAMGMCAQNLILLGDQMQLGQPIQGVHPDRSGESALEFLLDGRATIEPGCGIFLDTTYRMHPDLCAFISEAIYESRLRAHESTQDQALLLESDAHPALKPTGISYVPVDHDGCSQKSEEEAEVVRELVVSLLRQRYRDKQGNAVAITLDDILVVAPYNMQVNLLKRVLPGGARIGTVDKFQGQEAEVVIVSMAASGREPRTTQICFLFSKNRTNVAISRARCLSVIVASAALNAISTSNIRDTELANLFCRFSNFDQEINGNDD